MHRAAHFLVKRFRATIINDVWVETLFFSAVATGVWLLTDKYKVVNLAISNQILTVLGTVLGLVVSFRTSSAYERYQEGRKLWTSITLASRNLATLIWIHVPHDRPLKAGVEDDPKRNRTLEAVVEKRTMINLVEAFSVSVKHMLRGEQGIYYADLYPLVSFLPRYAPLAGVAPTDGLPLWDDHGLNLRRVATQTTGGQSPSRSSTQGSSSSHQHAHSRRHSSNYDPEKALPCVSSTYELLPAENTPPETVFDYCPPLIVFKPFVSLFALVFLRRRAKSDQHLTLTGKRRKPAKLDSNIPLEITLFLSSYFMSLMGKALLTPASASNYITYLSSLQDSVANLERVRNTPIPFAYQAHLRMCMWLYLFFLPFQIVAAYHVVVIPMTAFAAFLLLGFLEIGQEIEDPFGYDTNDLNLNQMCLQIQRELHEITAHPAPDPATYIFSASNQPFAPSDRRTAHDIVTNVEHEYHAKDTTLGTLHRTFLRNWREVNEFTRK